jgi:hypothetical protein
MGVISGFKLVQFFLNLKKAAHHFRSVPRGRVITQNIKILQKCFRLRHL